MSNNLVSICVSKIRGVGTFSIGAFSFVGTFSFVVPPFSYVHTFSEKGAFSAKDSL